MSRPTSDLVHKLIGCSMSQITNYKMFIESLYMLSHDAVFPCKFYSQRWIFIGLMFTQKKAVYATDGRGEFRVIDFVT
jgi:hypothetical protein